MLRTIARSMFPETVSRYAGARSMFKHATYKADGMLTTHNVDFLTDPKFARSFAAAMDGIPANLATNVFSALGWRAHVCCWAANQAMQVEGDFVECGVWYGVLSRALAEYTDFGASGKQMYLLDPWGGLTLGDSDSYEPDIYDAVQARFAKFSNVHMIRGLVPDTLAQVPSEKIAYLSIDMNGVEPERAALELFYPKVVRGGVIYFDDYACAGHPALKQMIDGFFADKPETIMYIPTGQGIVVKS